MTNCKIVKIKESFIESKEKRDWKKRRIFLIVDESVYYAQYFFFKNFLEQFRVCFVKTKENSKSLNFLKHVMIFLICEKVNRNSVLIIIGGGVALDLIGFAVSILFRGIDFYSIPTTLLSIVDGSIGGKTGINLSKGKNLIGLFNYPGKVAVNLSVLITLPFRDFNLGISEVIKYALIKDYFLWTKLTSSPKLKSSDLRLKDVVYKCCRLKLNIINNDLFEDMNRHQRTLLNLGHTFAHAIECYTNYKKYSHGEAVSIGIVMASNLSTKLGMISCEDFNEICNLLKYYHLPVRLHESLCINDLMKFTRYDKKKQSSDQVFIILKSIGDAIIIHSIDDELIYQSWIEINN